MYKESLEYLNKVGNKEAIKDIRVISKGLWSQPKEHSTGRRCGDGDKAGTADRTRRDKN